jgi:uncharacterized membrane protein YdjX (TVP38/TMEM64 family)
MAVGAVAGTGALSWLVEQGGTLLLLGALKNWTGANTLIEVFDVLAAWASGAGLTGMLACSAALTVLQLAPVCNGILAGMAAGLMFGTVKGLAVMSVSATTSAVVCLLLGRRFGGSVLGNGTAAAAATPELFRAVAEGIAGSWSKSLLLVSLVPILLDSSQLAQIPLHSGIYISLSVSG